MSVCWFTVAVLDLQFHISCSRCFLSRMPTSSFSPFDFGLALSGKETELGSWPLSWSCPKLLIRQTEIFSFGACTPTSGLEHMIITYSYLYLKSCLLYRITRQWYAYRHLCRFFCLRGKLSKWRRHVVGVFFFFFELKPSHVLQRWNILSPPFSTLHVKEPLEPFSFLTFHNRKRLCDSAALIRAWLC